MSVGIGLIVGLVLGLTGAGGSIFAVPLLMAGLGYSITQAATVSLLAVAISAGSRTACHRRT
ncbi:MAG TPA: TSUP family transporter [Aromatoleum sp.]|nr:TSUP family transporter [Aromatoleum sp.]HJV26163.1 TSUP family transporter [Aromatoleum sp.]